MLEEFMDWIFLVIFSIIVSLLAVSSFLIGIYAFISHYTIIGMFLFLVGLFLILVFVTGYKKYLKKGGIFR
jgi:membrane protease YdiL (CAAX protease family)